jgi:hypothetical protein
LHAIYRDRPSLAGLAVLGEIVAVVVVACAFAGWEGDGSVAREATR